MPTVNENDVMFQKFVRDGLLTVYKDGNVYDTSGNRRGYLSDYGYMRIEYRMNGVRYNTRIHRLVYITFKGYLQEGNQVNHINGDKTDNRLSNLEETTPSENGIHKWTFQKRKPTLTPEERDLILEYYNIGIRRAELADMFDTSVTNVYTITRISDRKYVQRNRKVIKMAA